MSVCISKYNKKKEEDKEGAYDLPGADEDMKTMTALFKDKVVWNKAVPMVTNTESKVDKAALDKLIKETQDKIEMNDCDALFVHFSCHGDSDDQKTKLDRVVLSDWKGISIRDIVSKFNGDILSDFVDKPKIFLFDCCRGNKGFERGDLITVIVTKMDETPEEDALEPEEDDIETYHPDCNQITLQPVTNQYETMELSEGGYLVRAFDQVLRSGVIKGKDYFLQNLCEDIKDTVTEMTKRKQCAQLNSTAFPYYNFRFPHQ